MMKITIIKLITMYSIQYGIPPEISLAVAAVESQFNPNAIGVTNDLGVFQLRPQSFPTYTKKQLLNPIINIQLGIKYLAKVKKECKYKDNLDWLTCYNMGPRRAKMIKHPSLNKYVKKVEFAINERNF